MKYRKLWLSSLRSNPSWTNKPETHEFFVYMALFFLDWTKHKFQTLLHKKAKMAGGENREFRTFHYPFIFLTVTH